MVFVVIAVVVLVALSLWVIVTVDSKGTEEGANLFIKWYEEHNEDGHSDTNPN